MGADTSWPWPDEVVGSRVEIKPDHVMQRGGGSRIQKELDASPQVGAGRRVLPNRCPSAAISGVQLCPSSSAN
jgi:hypothetical protein